jgi:hypothetical protein
VHLMLVDSFLKSKGSYTGRHSKNRLHMTEHLTNLQAWHVTVIFQSDSICIKDVSIVQTGHLLIVACWLQVTRFFHALFHACAAHAMLVCCVPSMHALRYLLLILFSCYPLVYSPLCRTLDVHCQSPLLFFSSSLFPPPH